MLDTTKQLPQNMAVPDTREVQNILGARKSRLAGLRLRNLAWLAVAAVIAAGAYVWSAGGGRATVNYITQNAVRGNLTVIVTATGSAQPITQVNVSSELSGTIRKVHVDYNSPVKVGQPLAELDTDKLKATVESVRAQLDAARAKVADTAATIEEKRAEYERKKELLTKGATTITGPRAAKAAYDRAVAAAHQRARRGQGRRSRSAAQRDQSRQGLHLLADRRRRPEAQRRSRPDRRLVAAGAGAVRDRRGPAAHGAAGRRRRGRCRQGQGRAKGDLQRRRLSGPQVPRRHPRHSLTAPRPCRASSPTRRCCRSTMPS